MQKNYQEYFKGKKVTVMGLGLLGRQIGDVAFLSEAGADVIVTDLKDEAHHAPALEQLQEYKNVTYVFGEHRDEDFIDRDFILVAPSVPLGSKHLQIARDHHIPLKQSAAWFAELSGVPIIGVTGTRGKSTVTMMIHHVLSFITGGDVLLGGNIRGVSNLQLLKEVKEDSLCVMELDSWQLQGWGWAQMSPQVAVFTNFMEDHMNYYQKSQLKTSDVLSKEEAMDLYFNDKAQIFLHQEESGVLVTTPAVFERAKALPSITLGQEVVLADSSVIPEDTLLAMPGEHNRLNAALAYQALQATGLTTDEILEGLTTFPGVDGRLQLVKTVDNVRIYNDNNATTPAATTTALQALDLGNKNIILITGGADKNIPLNDLQTAIAEHCKAVVTIPGTGTEKLIASLSESNHTINRMIVTESLPAAFEEARLQAENADIILFSPGFASFGQYKNEYERNDEFMSLVEKL